MPQAERCPGRHRQGHAPSRPASKPNGRSRSTSRPCASSGCRRASKPGPDSQIRPIFHALRGGTCAQHARGTNLTSSHLPTTWPSPAQSASSRTHHPLTRAKSVGAAVATVTVDPRVVDASGVGRQPRGRQENPTGGQPDPMAMPACGKSSVVRATLECRFVNGHKTFGSSQQGRCANEPMRRAGAWDSGRVHGPVPPSSEPVGSSDLDRSESMATAGDCRRAGHTPWLVQ